MRILYLGTSDDRGPVGPDGTHTPTVVEELLAESLGHSVKLIVKEAWPNEKLPGVLEGWMDEHDPDVVVICVNGYWFSYDSVPAKLRRILGRAGGPVSEAGLRLADVKWLAHNIVFRTGRRMATVAIGGDTPFTGRQVVERMAECVRVAVRREGTVVAMRGAEGQSPYAETGKGRDRKERLRSRVNRALAEMCGRHHVHFMAREEPLWRSHGDELQFIGDGIHKAGPTLRMRAERIALVIEEALRAAEAGKSAPEATGSMPESD